MSSRATDRILDDIESELLALGARLEWAPTPDFADVVASRRPPPTSLPARDHLRPWIVAAAAALLLVGALLAGSSSIRTSVAELLGIDGLRIEYGDPTTTPTSQPNLGTPTSMQDFTRWLPFRPMQPALLGTPDAVYLRVLENGDLLGMMAWNPDASLPAASETSVGALLMQFDPPDDIYMMLKTVGISSGSVTETTANNAPAFWIEGASDLTILGERSSESRPSANVLIWQQNGIGFRLESALGMDDALRIAESMEFVTTTS